MNFFIHNEIESWFSEEEKKQSKHLWCSPFFLKKIRNKARFPETEEVYHQDEKFHI